MRANEAAWESTMQAEDSGERVEARYYTISEASRIVGVSNDTIRRAYRSGALIAYKFKRIIRIKACHLDQWAEAQRYQPPASVTQNVTIPATTDYRW